MAPLFQVYRLLRLRACCLRPESQAFEGSIRECDTNLLRNVTYCNATVLSNYE